MNGVAPFRDPSPMAVPWLIATTVGRTPAPRDVKSDCACAAASLASDVEPESERVASGAAPSSAGSHVTWIEVVVRAGLHEPPSGTVPSPTVSVRATVPATAHVKVVFAEVGAENVPLGADQAYATAEGVGDVAVATSVTIPPTVVSVGLAANEP